MTPQEDGESDWSGPCALRGGEERSGTEPCTRKQDSLRTAPARPTKSGRLPPAGQQQHSERY